MKSGKLIICVDKWGWDESVLARFPGLEVSGFACLYGRLQG